MKKRMITTFLVLCLSISFVLPVGAANFPDKETETISLEGFSYNSDGSNIDEEYRYTVVADVSVEENSAFVSLKDVPDELSQYDLSEIELKKLDDNIYNQKLNDNIDVYLEKMNDCTILDVVVKDRVYAFGGERLDKVNEYVKTQKSDSIEKKDFSSINPDTSISPMATATGRVKAITHENIWFQAYWNPTNSNRLALLVNTVGERYGEWVSGIQITNAQVPNSYVIVSTNPSGNITGGNGNFISALTFLLNTRQYLKVWLPSYSGRPVSSTNANKFQFNLDLYAKWNDYDDLQSYYWMDV